MSLQSLRAIMKSKLKLSDLHRTNFLSETQVVIQKTSGLLRARRGLNPFRWPRNKTGRPWRRSTRSRCWRCRTTSWRGRPGFEPRTRTRTCRSRSWSASPRRSCQNHRNRRKSRKSSPVRRALSFRGLWSFFNFLTTFVNPFHLANSHLA